MANFDHNKTIRGTFGKLWLGDNRMGNVKSFEAKAAIDYEDMKVNGDFGTKKRYMGYSISGTMTLYKVDSYILSLYHKGVMNGNLPELKIRAALDDPTAAGTERVEMSDVKLDEVTLSKFENGTITEEEIPFTAGSFEFLDMIV